MAVADVRKPLVKDLHEHIVCPLCRGYLIDATTLVECLHSFCRGCIVRRLGSGARACPVCGALTLPPLLPDFALQRLVYLAVPGLYRSELDRRRHFRSVNPQCPPPAPPLGALALTLEDAVSLSLCEILNDEPASQDEEKTACSGTVKNHENEENCNENDADRDQNSSNALQIRYLKCPAGVTVRHLIRLLALKRGWGDTESKLPAQPKRIEMLYQKIKRNKPEMRPLELSWTLLDLACIFKWDKETPMKLFYRVVKRGEETITAQPAPQLSSYNTACNAIIRSNSNVNIENVQRPPTPPPSPKQSVNPEIRAPLASPRSLNLPQLQSVAEAAICKPTKPVINNYNPEPKPKMKQKTGTEQLEPKPAITNEAELTLTRDNKAAETEESSPTVAIPSSLSAPIPILQTGSVAEVINNCAPDGHTGGDTKVKKPRCEVTPVMRAPGPQGSSSPLEIQSNKPRKVPRLEHHKRRKRRNKRLIAEITTTPREDLLKLKVRLTPCPPRITSGAAGSAKEKLLQMRAVRREKIKSNTCADQRPQTPPSMPPTPPPSASVEKIPPPLIAVSTTTHGVELNSTMIVKEVQVQKSKSSSTTKETKETLHQDSKEETIEEIIDGIPDEVVRVAQNMNNCQQQQKQQQQKQQQQQQKQQQQQQQQQQQKQHEPIEEVVIIEEKEIIKPPVEEPALVVHEVKKVIGVSEKAGGGSSSSSSSSPSSSSPGSSASVAEGPKDEEVLRRLGLVAISEASKTLQDKIRGSQSGGGGSESGGGIDYHRESLERQLRESKANRVRSLLAEKQMRDALKSIMSKSKAIKSSSNSSSSSSTGPKKGPPPLAPLTLKQGFSGPPKNAHPAQILARGSSGGGTTTTGKNEKPLDLSSGAHNALDLSPTPSSSSNPVITSTTYNSAPVKPINRSKSSGSSTAVVQLQNQGKSSEEGKKNQDLNLRTLSDAAVSLLGTSPSTSPTTSSEVRITNSTILSGNKVALRIPQPHQRISGFGNGMKIKPNLAVRHIPNPQAFVASQYRNQRTNFFNVQQQPP